MPSLLIYTPASQLPAWLMAALDAAGLNATPVCREGTELVRQLQADEPEALLCWAETPDDAWFAVLRGVAAASPCAVIAFANDPQADHAERALAAGIHLYRTDACAAGTLPALLRIAQACCRHDQALQQALNDATLRLEERKVVDRAKVILMQARQMTDDDAFRVLRTASMHSNQRLGQVGQHIIEAARFAEGVNRAGQLRMLSQRLLLLHLFERALPTAGQVALRDDAAQRVDANLVWLGQHFSDPALASTVRQASATWKRLRQAVQHRPLPQDMARTDALGDQLLAEADRLTSQLEEAGAGAPLQVLNLAGRQRMLSQRFAKSVLLQALAAPALAQRSADMVRSTRDEFDTALHALHNLPLSSPDIRQALAEAKLQWQGLLAGADRAKQPAGLQAMADASEALLGTFEQLTAHYEHSLQMLVG